MCPSTRSLFLLVGQNWIKLPGKAAANKTVEQAVQEGRTNPPTSEGGIVYAELDLTQQQQGVTPRRINEDKTEYAEILYTKPETEETADK
ncbi:hypothetical protein ALC62_01330 [Cyphomyrmex costatus]|uniref:Uncharacterized protein n=1 Tax=Cyphomyrmex costatus TaxID=456900 RepID=A0A195D5W1_9HYME|nr:hypothetical protein ALC62_01330 [Cyphomyrmex costatus]